MALCGLTRGPLDLSRRGDSQKRGLSAGSAKPNRGRAARAPWSRIGVQAMTVPVQTLHAKAPRPHRDGSAPSRARPPAPLLPGPFFLLTTLSAPALASGNESWASDTIEHMRQHAYNSATGARPRGRRSAVEGLDS